MHVIGMWSLHAANSAHDTKRYRNRSIVIDAQGWKIFDLCYIFYKTDNNKKYRNYLNNAPIVNDIVRKPLAIIVTLAHYERTVLINTGLTLDECAPCFGAEQTHGHIERVICFHLFIRFVRVAHLLSAPIEKYDFLVEAQAPVHK